MRPSLASRQRAAAALVTAAAVAGLPLLAVVTTAAPAGALVPPGWNQSASGPPDTLSVACIASTNDCWAGGGSGASGFLDSSTDGGGTWAAVSGLPAIDGPVQSISCTLVDGDDDCWAVAPVGGTLTIVYTVTGGATWASVPTSGPDDLPQALGPSSAISCVTATTVCYVTDPKPGVMDTFSGTAWSTTGGLPSSPATTSVSAISCATSSTCYALAVNTVGPVVVATNSNGASWSDTSALTGLASAAAISCTASSMCYVAGATAAAAPQILVTADSGAAWVPQVTPNEGTVSSIDCIAATTCVAVGPGNGTTDAILAMNDGSTWWSQGVNGGPPTPYEGLAAVACTGSLACTAGGTSGIVSTTTGGASAAPAAPVSVVAYPGNGEATVAWVPPTSGGPFSSFSVSTSGTCSSCPVAVVGSDDVAVVSGLTNGSSYTFTVTAANGAGSGPSTSEPLPGITPSAPAITAAPTWSTIQGDQQVSSVSCPTSTECVAVGSADPGSPSAAGLVLLSSSGGSSWSSPGLPTTTTSLSGVGCASASVCFAVGSELDLYTGQSDGALLESSSSGGSWSGETVPEDVASLNSVSCATAADCVAVGEEANGTGALFVTPDGGSSWYVPVLPSGVAALSSVSCTSSSSPAGVLCAAVGTVPSGSGFPAIVYSNDGGYAWTLVPHASEPSVLTATKGLSSVSCPTVSDCYAVGPGFSSAAGTEVVVTTDGGSTWTAAQVSSSTNALWSVSCVESSGDDCWAVGSSGAAWTTSGGTSWTSQTSTTSATLSGISCPTVSDCTAVGDIAPGEPVALSTTSGGATWSLGTSGLIAGASTLSCDTTSLCVGVGSTWGAEVSTSGGSSFVETPLPAGLSSLESVSCPSTTECFAVGSSGSNGVIVDSTNGGVTWSSPQDAPNGVTSLDSIDCPSTSECVATGSMGALAIAILTTNSGGSWSSLGDPQGVTSLASVTCVSTSDCVAVGAKGADAAFVYTESAGTTWAIGQEVAGSYSAVSCASSSDCVEAGSNGSGQGLLTVTTDGGTGVSTVSPLPFTASSATLQSVTCPSTGVCLVGGYVEAGTALNGSAVDQGFVLSSVTMFGSSPAGGTWQVLGVPSTDGAVGGLVCPSAQDCLGSYGGVVQSTTAGLSLPGAPTIGIATVSGSTVSLDWTAPSITGGGSLTGYLVTPEQNGTPVNCTTCTGLEVSGTTTSTTITGLTVGTSYTFVVAAQNPAGTGPNSAQSDAVTPSAVTITTTSLPNGTVSVAYSQALEATGGTTPYTWSVVSGSLPTGLTLSSAGLVSGTPTVAGDYDFTVSVSDSSTPVNTSTQALSIDVPLTAVTITTTSLPDGVTKTAYSQTLAASGGTPPYKWSIPSGSLPAGLSLNATSGAISGTPTAIGTTPVTFEVTDSSSPTPQTAEATFSITVVSNTLLVTTTQLPEGQAGVAYSQSLGLEGGVPPYTITLTSGTLPSGLIVSSSGSITGIPAIPLTASFTLTVTDSESPKPASSVVSLEVIVKPSPSTQGYWEIASDGGVFSFGAKGAAWSPTFHGSMGGVPLNAPVVGGAATPDGLGYWEVASDGGVFTFGDAGFYGSMGGKHLNGPVVGIAPTPNGQGYWLVASDGGIFSFGNAAFYGSRGGFPYSPQMVAMASSPDGLGYWLVATNGAVFSFGDATFYGSMGGQSLQSPVVGFAVTPNGHGYWLVASDGGVFSFGDATFSGSLGGTTLAVPAIGIASTLTGQGYWVVTADGRVFPFGDATFVGSMGGVVLAAPVVAVVAP